MNEYQYILPLFLGHPFGANYTSALRDVVRQVCGEVTRHQHRAGGARFLWDPRFCHEIDSTGRQSVYDKVSEEIRQSALALFDITDKTRMNVFLELGIAYGMPRPVVILCRKPYDPPADLRGIRAVVYDDMEDLTKQLVKLLHTRLGELESPPAGDQTSIHLKMQIDATWNHRIRHAQRDLYIFAGDVSWAEAMRPPMQQAVARGVAVKVCCRRPDDSEAARWANIRAVHELGAKVKLIPRDKDPHVRGLIAEPDLTDPVCEAMVVEKSPRAAGVASGANGVTVGEQSFQYHASIYRRQSAPRQTNGLVRLFEAVWNTRAAQLYTGPRSEP